jgi:DNA-binding NtrC family response regulator
MHLPPLRERREDIPLLVEHFSREITERLGMPPKSFSSKALAALQSRPWKGNVRELKNVVERAVVLARASTLEEADLFLAEGPTSAEGANALGAPFRGLRAMEKEAILETLKQNGGNRTRTAKILGISVRTLRNKLREYDHSSGENLSDWESLSH